MESNYKHHVVTTINPATAVTCSAKGNFIKSSEENLIVCKGSTVEIYSIKESGIEIFKQFEIYGMITTMQILNIPDRETCSIFLLTDQHCFTIMTFNQETRDIMTEGTGILEETNARITDQSISTIIDLQSNMILVSAFTGLLFSIPYTVPLNSRAQARFQPASIKTNEFDLISMVSLKGVQESSLAALVGEINELKTVKVYQYQASLNELIDKKKDVAVEATTHMLISVPDPIGGVISIGEYIISYHDFTNNMTKEISIDVAYITAHTFLNDDYRKCILGDTEGQLYYLSLETHNLKVSNITSYILGQVSSPNSIVDLNNNLLYIGSTQGDSSIVRIFRDKRNKNVIELLYTFSNVGPITDFCLFDYNDQNNKQTMVCCSGVDKDGSLSIVEHGIAFLESYIIHDIPVVTQIWSLDQHLIVMTTPFETVLCQLQPQTNALQEYSQYSQLIKNECTISISLTSRHHLIQVTKSMVGLYQHSQHGKLLSKWTPPNEIEINIVKSNATSCLLHYGDQLVYLDVSKDIITEICSRQFNDVSCIDLKQNTVIIGMWTTPCIQLLQLPDLKTVVEKRIENGPKNVMLIEMEGIHYVMILLGDGKLVSYHYNASTLYNENITTVGTYCTELHEINKNQVFVAGTRPTLITSVNQKLMFSTINIKNVYTVTKVNNLIMLLTDIGLLFGKIDANQKLHYRKIELSNQEMPIRIEYLSKSKSLAIGTILNQKDLNNGFIKKAGKLQILDAQTFQLLDEYQLPKDEIIESMTKITFQSYPGQQFLFIGTVVESITEDPDHNLGRILVFDLKENNTLDLIEQVQMSGVVYNMKPFQDSIVASVNGSIYCLSKFQPDLPKGSRMEFKLNLHNNVLALALDTLNDKILVGDLMQSVSLLTKKEQDAKLRLLGVDGKPNWMTAVKFVSDNVYIGSDDRNNLFTLTLNNSKVKPSPSGVLKLELEGGYHVGSMINCIQTGTFNNNKKNNITFATIHGMIGNIKSISEQEFMFYKQLEDYILQELDNIGKLDHASWRNYKPKVISQSHYSNYIDGDVLKRFKYLSATQKLKICQLMRQIDLENHVDTLTSF